MSRADDVRAYWEERAAEASGAAQATTDDVWLRELEVLRLGESIAARGLAQGSVVDLGCGDGRTVLRLAAEHPGLTFVGIDYSEAMVDTGRRLLADQPTQVRDRVRIEVGDLTKLDESLGDEVFDVAMTDRVLINLATEEDQFTALAGIAAHVRPGGHYFAIENFFDGQENMNEARASVGLAPIPVRWHNLFIDELRFLAESRRWFDEVSVEDFTSTYYFVTRVAYSALCKVQGVSPDYEHPLHEIATRMPAVGRFSPIRLVEMRRAG
jgi:SAM-dependent methyltransferase